mgnify:CR=1 FL=1
MPTIVYFNSAYFPILIDREFCRKFPEPIVIAASEQQSYSGFLSQKGGSKTFYLKLYRKNQNAGRKKCDDFKATLELIYDDRDNHWQVIINNDRGMINIKDITTEAMLRVMSNYPELSELIMFHQEILEARYEPSESDIVIPTKSRPDPK